MLTYGLLAPRATPAVQVEALGQQILQVAGTPAFQSKLGLEGAEPMLGDAALNVSRNKSHDVTESPAADLAGDPPFRTMCR